MSLSQLDIEASITLFDDLQLDEIIDQVSYQGFEVNVMFNKVMSILRKDDRNGKRHLATLISIGLFRGIGAGKTQADIIDKSSSDGGARIKAAMLFYGVYVGKPRNKEDVTIPRIMICFPMLTYSVFNKRPLTKLTTDFDLPLEFAYPGSPAVMGSDIWAQQRGNYIKWSMLMSELWKKPTMEDNAARFADLSFGNTILKDTQRKHLQ